MAYCLALWLSDQKVTRVFWPDSSLAGVVIVQSLNFPFFPLHIGAEPGRAKRESRITCMRMLRTDLSKITRSQPLAQTIRLSNKSRVCRAMPFSARALKNKKNITFDVGIEVKNKSKCGLSWSALSSTSLLFSQRSFSLLSDCKRF